MIWSYQAVLMSDCSAGKWIYVLILQVLLWKQVYHEAKEITAETKQTSSIIVPFVSLDCHLLSYITLTFPLPSCSISTSVTTLTFPPFHLPLSSPSLSSFPSTHYRPTCPPSHSVCPKNSITIKMFVWDDGWGEAGGKGWINVILFECNDSSPGNLRSTERPLHICQLDKHKWEEQVDVKANCTLDFF